ncbi:hypothetical protein QL285_014755 [Trifolium repens]|nr:hypothetical protein QL285_014755 [Trifolium repens]
MDYLFVHFMDRVLTPHELGTRALYLWLMAPDYMTWYMKISHPYLEALPQGDTPRPDDIDAIIHDEAQVEGQRMATYVSKVLHIRQMIRALMASGDITLDSRPYSALQQIERDTHFFHQYRRRNHKGGPSTR